MIVLVTGGREYKNETELNMVLDRIHKERRFSYLVHGGALGADTLAHDWAHRNGVQTVAMDALWDFEGDDAGTRRNARMLAFSKPDLVIAFDGGRGTANMMRISLNSAEIIDVTIVDFDNSDRIVGYNAERFRSSTG